jgi:threonine aldolase
MFVNLYSDTQTRPASAMRTAMAEAEVGDEQRFEDPQVTQLCSRVASLGMEAAVFLPSGTMCNEIAFRLHIRPGGDEAILHRTSHPIIAEAGGVRGSDDAAARHPEGHVLRRGRAGCAALPRPVLAAFPARVRRAVDEHGGRPRVAAVAAARRGRRRFAAGSPPSYTGGALRQAGIVAAGALYALDHNVDRLAEDHANARALAERLAEIDGIALDPDEVETNIVIFDVDDAEGLCAALERHDVRMGAVGPRSVRAVTHLDVDADGVQLAVQAVQRVLGTP